MQRSAEAYGPWLECAPRALVPAAEMAFEDRPMEVRTPLWYRLVLEETAGSRTIAGPVAVSTLADLGPPALLAAFELPQGAVQIRYRVTYPHTPVRLTVLDVRGRLLWSERLLATAPGEYTHTWSGDGHGATTARGVYLVRLEAGPISASRKMVRIHR